MKKELKLEDAVKLLERGEVLECQLGSREDIREVVTTKERLEYLYNLSVQGAVRRCKIFKRTLDKVNIPENAIEMTFDEAYAMVYAKEVVFYQEEGEEKEINSVSELINIKRNFDIRAKELFLYWHE